MLCRLFDDLGVGTEARPAKPQQPPGRLTQIVTGGPNGELARPSKGICAWTIRGAFDFRSLILATASRGNAANR
jgi:hypothetical protein